MSDSFEFRLGSYGNVRQPTLEEMKRAHDSVPLAYTRERSPEFASLFERSYIGVTPSLKAFGCAHCGHVVKFPMDAVLQSIPLCSCCFGSMQAIDHVGAE